MKILHDVLHSLFITFDKNQSISLQFLHGTYRDRLIEAKLENIPSISKLIPQLLWPVIFELTFKLTRPVKIPNDVKNLKVWANVKSNIIDVTNLYLGHGENTITLKIKIEKHQE